MGCERRPGVSPRLAGRELLRVSFESACRLELRRRASASQLLGEQVHQQAVAQAAVLATLVGTHDADRPEADRGVGANRALVARVRIDRESVMTGGDEVSDR